MTIERKKNRTSIIKEQRQDRLNVVSELLTKRDNKRYTSQKFFQEGHGAFKRLETSTHPTTIDVDKVVEKI